MHQDGHGTVDSGHTCISGYNEIVILRRLPEQHKLRACSMMPSREQVNVEQQAKNMLYKLPHADLREDKPSWPTRETIDEMNRMKYVPATLDMQLYQFVCSHSNCVCLIFCKLLCHRFHHERRSAPSHSSRVFTCLSQDD